jgi:hypothetical protein
MKIKEIIVHGGILKGGYQFTVLETPTTQKYKIFAAKEFAIKGDRYFHGYLLGKEIQQKKLPIDANPRKPSPTKVVKLMQATMIREPENFHHLNNGMTIIASDLIYNEGNAEIEITFGATKGIHGDGLCNGGHTYFALEQFQGVLSDDLLVRIEILILDPTLSSDERSEKIKVISEARNAHNQLESITTAHYSGFYDNLIKTLGYSKVYFKWFEGDPDAVENAEKVDSLIAKLTALSPHWYSHYLNPTGNSGMHMPSCRGIGSIHTKWEKFKLNDFDYRSLDYMLPLISDILVLKDEICYSLLHDNYSKVSAVWRKTRIWNYLRDNSSEIDLLFKPGFTGYKLAHPWITLILGAFRENVWFSQDDSGINLVGWLVEPLKLWSDHRESLMVKLNAQAATVQAPSFGNAFIMQPAIYFDQLTEMEFGTRIRSHVAEPSVIYSVDTGEKYLKSDSGSFFLQTIDLDPEIPPRSELLSYNTGMLPCYVKS